MASEVDHGCVMCCVSCSTGACRQVRSEMASKRVLMVYRLNKAAFDYVVGEIHAKFMTAKVSGLDGSPPFFFFFLPCRDGSEAHSPPSWYQVDRSIDGRTDRRKGRPTEFWLA